jgi:transcriptional regulator with XRE-family HTH domain
MTEPDPIGVAVAKQIRKYRQKRGWSVRKLAEECTRLGVEITPSSLANIERLKPDARKGMRRVTVDELMVIAYVLAVPPILLLTPLGEADAVELVPGVAVHPVAARKWIVGTAHFGYHYEPLSVVPGLDMEQYRTAVKPLTFYWNELDRVFNGVAGTWSSQESIRETEGPESEAYARVRENYVGCLGDLMTVLLRIDATGLRLPPIPQQWLDDMRLVEIDLLPPYVQAFAELRDRIPVLEEDA